MDLKQKGGVINKTPYNATDVILKNKAKDTSYYYDKEHYTLLEKFLNNVLPNIKIYGSYLTYVAVESIELLDIGGFGLGCVLYDNSNNEYVLKIFKHNNFEHKEVSSSQRLLLEKEKELIGLQLIKTRSEYAIYHSLVNMDSIKLERNELTKLNEKIEKLEFEILDIEQLIDSKRKIYKSPVKDELEVVKILCGQDFKNINTIYGLFNMYNPLKLKTHEYFYPQTLFYSDDAFKHVMSDDDKVAGFIVEKGETDLRRAINNIKVDIENYMTENSLSIDVATTTIFLYYLRGLLNGLTELSTFTSSSIPFGFLHIDIKPNNIIIVKNNGNKDYNMYIPKLIDFGGVVQKNRKGLVHFTSNVGLTFSYLPIEYHKSKIVDGVNLRHYMDERLSIYQIILSLLRVFYKIKLPKTSVYNINYYVTIYSQVLKHPKIPRNIKDLIEPYVNPAFEYKRKPLLEKITAQTQTLIKKYTEEPEEPEEPEELKELKELKEPVETFIKIKPDFFPLINK